MDSLNIFVSFVCCVLTYPAFFHWALLILAVSAIVLFYTKKTKVWDEYVHDTDAFEYIRRYLKDNNIDNIVSCKARIIAQLHSVGGEKADELDFILQYINYTEHRNNSGFWPRRRCNAISEAAAEAYTSNTARYVYVQRTHFI